MNSQLLIEQLSTSRTPVFLADSEGLFINDFIVQIAPDFLPVVLTRKAVDPALLSTCIVIPLHRSMPKIPDNAFSAILFVEPFEKSEIALAKALLQEAKRRNIPFLYVASLYSLPKSTFKDVSAYQESRIFLYGEIVGGSASFGPVNETLEGVKKDKRILLKNQGMEKVFPVSVGFVVSTVTRYGFLEKPPRNTIALLPEGDLLELSVARLLQHSDQMLTIDFIKKKNAMTLLPPLPKFIHYEQEPLTSLKQAFTESLKKDPPDGSPQKKRRPPLPYMRFYKSLFLVVACVLMLFSLVIFFSLGMAAFGANALRQSVNAAFSLKLPEARKQIVFARSAFALSTTVIQPLTEFAKFIKTEQLVSPLTTEIRTGVVVSQALENAYGGLEHYSKLLEGEDVSRESILKGNQEIKQAQLTLNLLQAEEKVPERYQEGLRSIRKLSELFVTSSDLLPQLLGYEKPRTYLFLLQNNNELRPGGGFIGSYALLTLNSGKVKGFSIHDVYDADGQLTGHVEPPFGLKRYLGAAHWYLRDSNFSPDFPENAATAAFFLNLETGVKADGVVALDTRAIQGLLAATGPLRISGYEETVTADNFVAITQTEVEEGFFPGSTQKRDFLTKLYEAGTRKIFEEKNIDWVKFLAAISSSLTQKHILLAFPQPEEQLPFTLSGVSSTLQTRADAEGIDDFIGVSEANVGVNKVNQYIERSLRYDLSLSEEGTITTAFQLSLANTSDEKKAFGGDYKVYLRFVLPEGASPQEISLNGQRQVVLTPLQNDAAYADRGSVAENTLEVDRVDEKGKTIYGFILTIPQQSKKIISLRYALPQKIGETGGIYRLSLFKQPGTGADPYRFSVALPQSYTLLSSSLKLEKEGDTLVALSRLSEDREIELTFGRK